MKWVEPRKISTGESMRIPFATLRRSSSLQSRQFRSLAETHASYMGFQWRQRNDTVDDDVKEVCRLRVPWPHSPC